jgi:hypothetical protein
LFFIFRLETPEFMPIKIPGSGAEPQFLPTNSAEEP